MPPKVALWWWLWLWCWLSALATGAGPATPSICPSVVPVVDMNLSTTALASYPGSGSTVSRMLIEMATGRLTGSVYRDKRLWKAKPYPFRGERRQRGVVGIKTHAPWTVTKKNTTKNMHMSATKVVLLVRDPRHAVPSFFNWFYAHHHNHKSHQEHTAQAPLAGPLQRRSPFNCTPLAAHPFGRNPLLMAPFTAQIVNCACTL